MWEDLFHHLKEKGFAVYSIGQHKGECEKPYIVLKSNGQYGNQGAITGYSVLDVIAYYPAKRYSEIENFKNTLFGALKSFKGAKYTGNVTADFLDEEKKAYTFSTKLQIFKRI